jgi:anti-sigma-K factor RskA
MPEVMSGGDTDALAAEYVIGTLDSDERAHAQTLLAADESFLTKVKLWERRLGELHLMVEPVEPDAQIWERIKGKMPEVRPDGDREHTGSAPEEATVQQQEATVQQLEPTLVPAEMPAPSPETPGSAPDAAPAPTSDATAGPAPGIAPSPAAESDPPPPAAVAAPGVIGAVPLEAREVSPTIRRRLGRWRAFALLLTLVVAAAAALLALWRFAPETVPAPLQPRELMRRMGVELPPSPSAPPTRRASPPASHFEE